MFSQMAQVLRIPALLDLPGNAIMYNSVSLVPCAGGCPCQLFGYRAPIPSPWSLENLVNLAYSFCYLARVRLPTAFDNACATVTPQLYAVVTVADDLLEVTAYEVLLRPLERECSPPFPVSDQFVENEQSVIL